MDYSQPKKTFKDKVKFSFEDHEYDQSSYYGRFMHFFDVVNPKRFFIPNSKIKEAQDKIYKFKVREEVAKNLGQDIYVDKEEVPQLIEEKKIVDATIHPDTGEKIPFYFRMSGNIIFNSPILFGVLMSKQTPLNIMFFQWLNQSYNAGLNYGNRNASSPYTQNDILKGYTGAVVTSLTIALTLNKLFSGITSKMPPNKKLIASTFFNWIAVSAANVANISLMRYKELKSGIAVKDETGYEHGKSVEVAKLALAQTAVSRVIVPFAVMAFPTAIVTMLRAKNLAPQGKIASSALEVSLCALALGLSLPAAIAMFPQQGTVNAEKLESQFQNCKDAEGNIVKEFYFNKGL